MIFEEQCYRCRHNIDDRDNPQPTRLEPPFVACSWGILDRLLLAMWVDPGGAIENWYEPGLLDTSSSPADCRKFTPRDYPGDDRDPLKPDVPGQMTFEDVLVVPERVPRPADAEAR